MSGEPYRVPALLNARRTVMAVDCTECGTRVRMGPHSMASARRVIAALGALCNECRVKPTSTTSDVGGGLSAAEEEGA